MVDADAGAVLLRPAAGVPTFWQMSAIRHFANQVGLLPAAAERFIELDQALVLVVSRFREREFRLE